MRGRRRRTRTTSTTATSSERFVRSATVAIGVPLRNGGAYVETALASLLAQRYRDAAFLLVDDASTDGTAGRAADAVAGDDRASLVVNATRIGMVHNWRRALELATAAAPAARYFAWGSDHDLWDVEWLEALVAELDAHPDAVLAYPLVERIDERGAVTRGPWHFAATAADPDARFRAVVAGVSAGNMIYGLFRLDALRATGGPQPVVGFDRLLLTRLSLAGTFRQVPRVLWQRRFQKRVDARSQRRALFAGSPPATAYLPWPLQHGLELLRPAGPAKTALYVADGLRRVAGTRARRAAGGARRRARRR